MARITARERMNPLVEQLVDSLREFVPHLSDNPGADRALCGTDGTALGELLDGQDDATLAGALRFNVCRNAIIEELLVVRYHRQLLLWFRGFGADEHAAEDLTQDVFARIIRGALNTFDPNRPFAGYLRSFARHLHLSSVRGQHPSLSADLCEHPGSGTPLEDVAARELSDRFDNAVSELGQPDRDIMRLAVDGHAPQEIATLLGLGINLVYMMLARSRRALEQQLGLSLPPPRRGRPPKGTTE
jgi:RNA polymerase sigma factor (sigma-70 family)